MTHRTFFGNKVTIPNCPACSKWIGTHNCKDEEVISSDGATIIKTECAHYYHGNCCKKKGEVLGECIVCCQPFTSQ